MNGNTPFPVTQIFNLLYRRFPICQALQHSRLNVGVTSDCKSALPRLFLCVLSIGLMAVSGFAAEQAKEEKGAEPAKEEKAGEAPSRVKRGPNGEVTITVDAATQQTMGLETAALGPAQLSPEVKGYGRVLDISQLAALVAELNTAQAANDASQADLERLKTLAAQSNASTRALQAAQAAAAHDQVQVDSTRLRLLANWGSAIAERQDLGGFVRALGSLSSALVELDVPVGQTLTNLPTGARLISFSQDTAAIAAQYLGPVPTVDPQMQARGFLFLISPNSLHLAPGTALTGFLELPGEPAQGVLLPRNAVVRFNGTGWVYLQTGPDTFQRREVSLDRILDKGWFIQEGLKPEDKVVTVGAQQLLSEERKGQGEE